jgi:hypothetical protein
MCLLATVLLISANPPAPNVRAVLESRYRQVTKGMQSHNMSMLGSILAPEFKAQGPNGKAIARAEILTQFNMESKNLKDISWQRKIEKLQVDKFIAVAIVSGHLSALSTQTPSHRIELIATSRDTWKNDHGRWLLLKSQVLSSKMKMDGKPMHLGAQG